MSPGQMQVCVLPDWIKGTVSVGICCFGQPVDRDERLGPLTGPVEWSSRHGWSVRVWWVHLAAYSVGVRPAEAGVGSPGVALGSPVLDDDLGFGGGSELGDVQQLVADPDVERLDPRVVPALPNSACSFGLLRRLGRPWAV
jgi:hypothetical protein